MSGALGVKIDYYLFNVHGDAALVSILPQSQQEFNILIDAGYEFKDNDLSLLEGKKINRIVITHWHKDHCDGLKKICGNVQIDFPKLKVYCPATVFTEHETYPNENVRESRDTIIEKLLEKGVKKENIFMGYDREKEEKKRDDGYKDYNGIFENSETPYFSIVPDVVRNWGCDVKILAVDGYVNGIQSLATYDGINDSSVSCLIECGKQRLLTSGDLGRNNDERVRQLIKKELKIEEVQLFKLNHHGSSNNNGNYQIQDELSLNPQIILCSYNGNVKYFNYLEEEIRQKGIYFHHNSNKDGDPYINIQIYPKEIFVYHGTSLCRCVTKKRTTFIPTNVTNIEEGCYCGCKKLNSLLIPKTLTSLRIVNNYFLMKDDCLLYVFNCSKLTSILLPDSISSIGDYCFYNCSSLRSIRLPSSITSIGKSCFSQCVALKSITLPDTISSIGDYCFCDCSSWNSIRLPSLLSEIKPFTFSGCSGLKNIFIPPSIKNIVKCTFNECDLQTVYCVYDCDFDDYNWCFSNPVRNKRPIIKSYFFYKGRYHSVICRKTDYDSLLKTVKENCGKRLMFLFKDKNNKIFGGVVNIPKGYEGGVVSDKNSFLFSYNEKGEMEKFENGKEKYFNLGKNNGKYILHFANYKDINNGIAFDFSNKICFNGKTSLFERLCVIDWDSIINFD